MSTRAMRKLQGDSDLVIPGLAASSEEEGDEEESHGLTGSNTAISKKKNKKKKFKHVVNPFDLLNEEENESGEVYDLDDEKERKAENNATDLPEQAEIHVNTNKGAEGETEQGKRPKKKKKRKKKNKGKEAEEIVDGEDEIEASVREVNAILGELPATNDQVVFDSNFSVTMDMKALLTVEHKHLNPDNEMRRIFGARVVQPEQRERRGRNRPYRKSTWLARPKDTWPHMGKSGLTMTLLDTHQGVQYFVFEHSHQFQQVQTQFLDAVDSYNPQNITEEEQDIEIIKDLLSMKNELHLHRFTAVLQLHPYHIDSLLQLSEVCKMSEDVQMATELIERALYAFECSFHPLFSLTQGNCRLDYRRPENRSFYIALFHHLNYVGQRGCYRTALEICKLLLRMGFIRGWQCVWDCFAAVLSHMSLDPEGDPLCVLLMIDFFALKSEQYTFLVRMYHEWEAHRKLSQLPNFAMSVSLAMFHLAELEGGSMDKADQMLQDSLLMFSGLLMPLIDRCNVVPDSQVAAHTYFSTATQLAQPVALKQLMALYVGRSHACWKEPQVMTWLERNVREVMHRVDADDPLVEEYKNRRQTLYRGTPRNIFRHILMSEIKDATAALPPEMAHTAVMSYDPLPPTDSILSYARPERRTRAQQDGGTLSMFLRSLMPNFNPQEVVDEAAGAAGGQPQNDLRQGIGALMDAMRNLLHNIQPAAPPVENDHGGENEDQDQIDEWD